jgi:hypothetical protein
VTSSDDFWADLAAHGIDREYCEAIGRELAAGLSADQIANVRAIIRRGATKAGPCDDDRPSADPDHRPVKRKSDAS